MNVNQPSFSEEIFHFMVNLNHSFFSEHELMREFPLPPSHVKVLFYLLHSGESSISDISKRLYISKPNMTPIIDKLILEGLAKRHNHPTDRRTFLIALTQKGHQMFEEHKQYVIARIEDKIKILDESDKDTFKNCILQLLPIFHKVAPPLMCFLPLDESKYNPSSNN
ncbi:MAG: MarR family winged helix-turn-helix transcriptional regulator [Cellulosilyticaceae bacterium]